jgi:ribonuclease P protein component
MGEGDICARVAILPGLAMPPVKPARFPRSARLLRHADFERVYQQGFRYFSATMTVFYLARPRELKRTEEEAGTFAPDRLRVGFTVGRALGGAVQRNRLKRRLREAVRLSHGNFNISADVVINPKKGLLTAEFSEVLNEMDRAFSMIERKLSGGVSQKISANTPTGAGSARNPQAES